MTTIDDVAYIKCQSKSNVEQGIKETKRLCKNISESILLHLLWNIIVVDSESITYNGLKTKAKMWNGMYSKCIYLKV